MAGGSSETVKVSSKSGKERSVSASDGSSSSSVTTRSSSKHSGKSDQLISGKSEAFLHLEVENRLLERINSMLREVESRMTATFYDALDSLKSRVSELESKVEVLQQKHSVLENECEDMRRIARLPDAIIRGIPGKHDENLRDIVQDIASGIGHTLSPHFEVFRVRGLTQSNGDQRRSNVGGSTDRAIIVRFSCTNERRAFISSFKRFGKYKLNRVSGFTSESTIYINESLSPKNNIFHEVLRLRKTGQVASVFTSNGFVHVKFKPEGRAIKLLSLGHLRELCETGRCNE